MLFGDRAEWSSPEVPKVGHTQFMKLSERVDALEKRLARMQGFSDGRL